MMEQTKMIKLQYKVTFTTPAFLGNAEQCGQWRTPPFKALLRHWWRVAVAQECGYDCEKIREAEGRLFGHAWLKDDKNQSCASKSQVRMRLDKWTAGSTDRWQSLDKIGNGNQVAADLYLGYGPVEYNKVTKKTSLKKPPALQAKDSAILSLAMPENCEHKIIETLALIDRFGTLGGRSRNGWGSVSLEPQGDSPALSINPRKFSAELGTALECDWARVIGCDGQKLLIWETEPCKGWEKAMVKLAELRKGLNANFKNDRTWLNYPVTQDNRWVNKRLPSSLRFKVVPAEGGVKGIVFHLPCLPPQDFHPEPQKLIKIWRNVHKALDDDDQLTRQET